MERSGCRAELAKGTVAGCVKIIGKIRRMQRQEAEEGSWLAWQSCFITG